ncbi:MAG: hypothetical protein ACYSWU_09610 [Planctomycetota bacterium]|jgi:hypothetical protein
MVLSALRCLVRPYWGITHDAKLYAVQVMNRAKEGFFDQDLFFLYGSQDDYSAFSVLMAPLASKLGLSLSFFVVYVASVALLIFAEIRLVRALVPDRTAGNVALVLLAVTDLPWGGWDVLHVHESFLTPRLPAAALTLLGLEQFLRKRFVSATALMLAAMALHPLMAIGGLVLAVASACAARLSLLKLLAIGATTALAATAVLLHQPLGTRLFGYIDPQWHDIVQRRCPYSFPATWSVMDWWQIAYALVVVVVGCAYLDRHRATMMRLVILLALGGVAGSVATEAYPYALLLQGQPQRVLWLLQFFALPLGVLVTFRLWQKGTIAARLASALVFCFTTRLLLPNSLAVESITLTLATWVGLLVLFAVIFHRAESRNVSGTIDRAGWLCPSVLASLAATGLWMSLTDAAAFCLGGWGKTSPVWSVWLAPSMCSDAVLALAGILLIAGLWSAAKDVPKTGVVAAAVWVGLSAAVFFLQQERGGWDPFAKDRADVSFVRQFVREHWPERDRAPSVYWPTEPNHVWFDVPARSFYSWPQTAGVAFSRGTAVEGQRRALLVRKYEITEMRQSYDRDVFWDFFSGFYRATIDEPGPTRRDLIALCNEEELDFVVLPRVFKDLAAGTNGTVFVYDCRSVRSRQLSVLSHQSTDN